MGENILYNYLIKTFSFLLHFQGFWAVLYEKLYMDLLVENTYDIKFQFTQ